MTHFRRPPVASTEAFVTQAPLGRLETGVRGVVEIIGYPDGQLRLVTSRIEGATRARRIVQSGVLMFRDVDEAKDALDLLADRIAAEAAGS